MKSQLVRGGVNLDFINRIYTLEETVARLERNMQIKATKNNFGIVKLSDSTTITQAEGIALPATEKNAAIAGSLANEIKNKNAYNFSIRLFEEYAQDFHHEKNFCIQKSFRISKGITVIKDIPAWTNFAEIKEEIDIENGACVLTNVLGSGKCYAAFLSGHKYIGTIGSIPIGDYFMIA